MKLIKKNNKGFSLVELILVLGLSSLIFLGALSIEKRNTESLKAKAAGQQIEEVGKALGAYIANQRGVLTSGIAANTTVSIPLTVLQGVTSGTYPGKQYLPASFNPQNAFGTGYRLQIRNNGSDSLTGIVITDTPVVDETGAVRYDWLGYAARIAGAQSGMSFFTGTQITGLNAGWTIPNSQFSSITAAGQLAYRSQFQGSTDDTYLRRDGLYPMNGNLNMGNNNIKDATDINFNGFLNGNNALLNNLQSGYILNNGNIQNNGSFQNNANIHNLGDLQNDGNMKNNGNFQNVGDLQNDRNMKNNGNFQNVGDFQNDGNAKINGDLTVLGSGDFNRLKIATLATLGTIQLTDIAVVHTGCAPNGQVSRDANGGILSCNAGVWSKGINFNAAFWVHAGSTGPWQCPPSSVMIGTYGWWSTYTDVYYLCAPA